MSSFLFALGVAVGVTLLVALYLYAPEATETPDDDLP